MQKRIEKLVKLIEMDDQTGYLITEESNVTYLSGFSGEASMLILSKKGNVLMTDGRYDEQARTECGEHFEITKWHNPRRPDPETIIAYIKKFHIKKLIFNQQSVNFQTYDHLKKALLNHNLVIELIPMVDMVLNLRSVKEAEEILLLKKACEISDLALEKTVPMIKVGVTELEVVATLEYHMKMLGAENISFDTIAISGKKTSLPHGKPSTKKLEVGDFLQLDFGALYKGYHADMSRTFIIGEASEKQKKLYAMMLAATLEGTKALCDGIPASEPDAAVRSVIDETHLKYYYPGLGHGVGLDVHESPRLSQNTKDILKAGQVVTIEPGVYIPDWGGMRIEDTVVVTKNGYEVLTTYPRKLQILK